MLTGEMTVSVGESFLPTTDPFAGPEFNALGKFLLRVTDPREMTERQAVAIKELCRELGVSFKSYCELHNVRAQFIADKFPAARKVLMPKGPGLLVLTEEICVQLRARAKAERAAAPALYTKKPPTMPAMRITQDVTVTIQKGEGTMPFVIRNLDDVQRVTDVLQALTR